MTDLSSIFDDVIETDIPVKPPVALLHELGQELEKKTQGLLTFSVIKGRRHETFLFDFRIFVPSLNNYSYDVFSVEHGFALYPLKISFNNNTIDIVNEEILVETFKAIFADPKIKRVINGLLAQAKYS